MLVSVWSPFVPKTLLVFSNKEQLHSHKDSSGLDQCGNSRWPIVILICDIKNLTIELRQLKNTENTSYKSMIKK